MSSFSLYFSLGRDHILDYANGYDHILFVLALCSVYVIRDWKKILILVTAFTIGHSVTLALATLQIISVDTALIELLIPHHYFDHSRKQSFQKNGDTLGQKYSDQLRLCIVFRAHPRHGLFQLPTRHFG
jgi:hypothetical protein